jgi:integrase
MAKRGNSEGSIHKRVNGTWRAQVSLDGKRISYTAETRAEAHEWLRKMMDQVDRGMTVESRNTKLSEFLLEWIKTKSVELRIRTAREYGRLIEMYINPHLGNTKLKDLSMNQVNRFYQSLLERGVGISNLRYTHRVLHTALEYALKTGVLARNPAHGASLPRKVHKEMITLTDQQVGQFLIAAQGSRYQALYLLAVTTGMRISELRGLQWQDVDWLRGTIKVSRQLQEGVGKGMAFTEPKTHAGYRTIKVGETTLQQLQKHRERIALDKMVAGDRWMENDLIVPSSRGTPFIQSNVRKNFNAVLDAANVPRIRFHDLRHTAASLMLNHGIPVIVVSRRLGHSNASVTLNIYAHTTVDMQNEAAMLMDELITPIPVDLPKGDIAFDVENRLHPVAPELKVPPNTAPTSGTNQ